MIVHQPALAAGTDISLTLHAVFDTGTIIDTFGISPQDYQRYAQETESLLRQRFPAAKWQRESALTIHSTDDLSDYLPILNLSYVAAVYPELLARPRITLTLRSGTACTLTFSTPTVYFHSFSGGIVSLTASLDWSRDYTVADLLNIEQTLPDQLGPLLEERLRQITDTFRACVRDIRVPLYTSPFPELLAPGSNRSLLYWSHRIYVVRTPDEPSALAAGAALAPLMRPIDQSGVQNMALKPDRFIYLGSGSSVISCPATLPVDVVASYARMVEIRNYLWKTLYDLDRGLRFGVVLSKSMRSPRQARRLVRELRALDFRVKSVLEEMEPYKITFDNEKIWLMGQLDRNWLTPELVASVQARLSSFSSFYAYSEETLTREQEERLRSVLNLIGVFATAGAIAQIVSYFDPTNQLAVPVRGLIFSASLLLTLLVFYLALVIARRVRLRD